MEPADPDALESRALMAELSDALERMTGRSGASGFRAADVQVPRAVFVVARDAAGTAVGCGALRPLEDGVAEVKRMYARPGTRGVGSAVLRFLESAARAWGYAAVWLETGDVNARGIAFYQRHGYVRIPNFGRYAGRTDAVCLGKALAADAVLHAAPPSAAG
ncbi:MAG TPA: GNAT family N-acetyltransferase [Longimicrobium sp.]|nr:GNAT family N-acetyltransferase [Longimicrobium sp.]